MNINDKKIINAFKRYRIISIVSGLLLILLLVFAFISRTIFTQEDSFWDKTALYLGIMHGWGYMIYFLLSLDFSLKMRFEIKKILIVLISGTIPLMSFYTERKIRLKYFN